MNDFDNKQICSYKDIDRFGFTCDVCGRKVNGCHYINGMSFCEKCYQETFGKDNQQNEIQQLKQQLAEKDKEIETMKKDSDKNIDYLVEFASLIENEKDCNRMLKALDRVKSGNKYIIDKANQSKTEFAIQELEKVKDTLKHFCNIHNDEYYGVKSQVKGIEQDVCEEIDNQIKVLKGE